MIAVLLKEIRGFFISLTGYLAIIVFLLFNGLFIWVLPTDYNLLNYGYASLDVYFMLAPWVLLFLIPSITMRMFAEEKKAGTLELLLTRPLTEMQIVLAKYLATLTIVILALLPTLIYFISVYYLSSPAGNMDVGGTWGCYIGLLLLACSYAALGIFSSALTDNIVVSFILAVLLCFIFYIGFDTLSAIPYFKGMDEIILKTGINEHYKSLSRGVVDSRDIIYFLCLISVFILFTKTRLESRKW
jgi:ABC-2 type transport system permease protein